MKITRRQFWVLTIISLCMAGIALGLTWHFSTLLPKRFAAVVEGRLYRSGSVSPEQLTRLHELYDIRRVICLLDDQAQITKAEYQAATTLNIEWHNIALPGDGSSTAEDRQRILALLKAPSEGATLVHCAAGSNRTGLAIGLYHLHCDGWSLPQVLEEMRSHGFKDKPHHENLRQALAREAAIAPHSTPESLPAP
ncbi:MAG: hypothetical protein ABIG44_08860 [Planctomycetota bacterium]